MATGYRIHGDVAVTKRDSAGTVTDARNNTVSYHAGDTTLVRNGEVIVLPADVANAVLEEVDFADAPAEA